MEYCDRGDLALYLKNLSSGRLGKSQGHNGEAIMEMAPWRIWKFFISICLGLNYIHDKDIVHADLKPHNILLCGKDYNVKIGDFGIS